MDAPLKLFWWKQQPNFGDRLSREVVAHVSGRAVAWARPEQAEIYGVGSLMHIVRRVNKVPREDGSRPVVWGTGMMGPVPVDFRRNLRFAAVRGPLTTALLDLPDLPLGDPGVLAAAALGQQPDQDDRIALVLHHAQVPAPEVMERIREDGRFRVIDVTARDHMGVVAAIGGCRHVISSSLHGLIVADSFGVGSTWLDPSGIHPSARLKFYDYALSVGRLLNAPIPLAAIFDLADSLSARGGELPHAAGVAAAAEALCAAFPAGLRKTGERAVA